MDGNGTLRPGLKDRYRQPRERERSSVWSEPFDGYAHRRKRKGQRHLPFLHLQLPYSTESLFDLLEGDSPIVNAEVRNNGNAPAITPVVELVTSPLLIYIPEPSGPYRQWTTMGVTPVGALYPHQSREVTVDWDWSKVSYPTSPMDRRFWSIFCTALCYDPVLDPRPRPDFEVGQGNQSPYNTKVVTIWSLS